MFNNRVWVSDWRRQQTAITITWLCFYGDFSGTFITNNPNGSRTNNWNFHVIIHGFGSNIVHPCRVASFNLIFLDIFLSLPIYKTYQYIYKTFLQFLVLVSPLPILFILYSPPLVLHHMYYSVSSQASGLRPLSLLRLMCSFYLHNFYRYSNKQTNLKCGN